MSTATEIVTNANLQNSYWGEKIIAAEKRGHFTLKDKRESSSWVTCACGKTSYIQEKEKPVGHWDSPNDDLLFKYGEDFGTHVALASIDERYNKTNQPYMASAMILAAKTLVKIEERACSLTH